MEVSITSTRSATGTNWYVTTNTTGQATGYASVIDGTVQTVVRVVPGRQTHRNVRIEQGSLRDIPEKFVPCCVPLCMVPPNLARKTIEGGLMVVKDNIKPVGLLKKLLRNYMEGRIRNHSQWDQGTFVGKRRYIYELIVWNTMRNDEARLRMYLIHNGDGTADPIESMNEVTYAKVLFPIICGITLQHVVPVPPHMNARTLSEEIYIEAQRKGMDPYATILLQSQPVKQ